ncbi:Nramp family divalent metal transporter [Isosphaeraceae bacterium EP7]
MAPTDPYALPADAIQDPPTSLLGAMRKIGPGLILAGSIVGTGELIATTGLGAEQGYVLLWLILFSCVIKVFVQVELGRYAITHGKTTLAALDTLPGPRLGVSWICWAWLLMMLATQAQIAAMEGLIGQAAHMTFPRVSFAMAGAAGSFHLASGAFLESRPEHVWATLTAIAAVVLLLSGGYKRLERITTTLVALVTLITVACVLGLSWTDYPLSLKGVVDGLKVTVPTAGVALAFSAFGITGVGASELFAYPYWCIEKGYARSAGPRDDSAGWAMRAKGWMHVMQVDAWFSMLVFTAATIAFYLLGAAVLHPQGLVPKGSEMLETLSRMYVEPLGPWTRSVFLVGAWAVLFKTLYVATAANSRLSADFLDLAGFWRQPDAASRERTIRAFCVFYPALALGLYFGLRDPKALVTLGGYAQGLMLPVIAAASLYLTRRDRVASVAEGPFSKLLSWVAFLSITAVASYSVYDLLARLR